MARSRSSTIALSRLLHDSPTPVYVLSGARKIVFANQACAEWFGTPLDSLVGRQVDYCPGTEGDQFDVNALCPPPQSFRGERVVGTICRLAEGERIEKCPTDFVPLGSNESCVGVLAIVGHPAADDEGRSPLELSAEELHGRLAGIRLSLARAHSIDLLIGESQGIAKVREQVQLGALSDANVFVYGLPGSGREHIARSIHYGRHSDGGWLVPLECGQQTPESIQQAVTSLVREHRSEGGAHQPALLLLDADELTAEAQHELDGFLALPGIALRVVSTSQRSAEELVNDGFRDDLVQRLSTLTIRIPPLAERTRDVPLLSQHFLEDLNRDGVRQWSGFSTAAMEELVLYGWPGNVDELRSVVREACEASSGGEVQITDLPQKLQFARQADARAARDTEPIDLDAYLEQVERELIQRALRLAKGNKTKAAELLGVTRARLHRRLQSSEKES